VLACSGSGETPSLPIPDFHGGLLRVYRLRLLTVREVGRSVFADRDLERTRILQGGEGCGE
jgi:hypothetical protein